jgi:hypothetical protein
VGNPDPYSDNIRPSRNMHRVDARQVARRHCSRMGLCCRVGTERLAGQGQTNTSSNYPRLNVLYIPFSEATPTPVGGILFDQLTAWIL